MVAEQNWLSDINFSAQGILRIGVTGHRTIPAEDPVRSSVRKVFQQLDEWLASTGQKSPCTWVIVSPLAEGADRIVVEEALDRPLGEQNCRVSLEAVFPLVEEDYIADFKTAESRAQFTLLKQRARSVASLRAQPVMCHDERLAAYEAVGRYVVDHCDIIIAVWDGQPSYGRGGTAEIIKYADSISRPYVWINARSGEIRIA